MLTKLHKWPSQRSMVCQWVRQLRGVCHNKLHFKTGSGGLYLILLLSALLRCPSPWFLTTRHHALMSASKAKKLISLCTFRLVHAHSVWFNSARLFLAFQSIQVQPKCKQRTTSQVSVRSRQDPPGAWLFSVLGVWSLGSACQQCAFRIQWQAAR